MIASLSQRIVSIGVRTDLPFHEARKIRLLNSMALVGICAFFFLLVFNILKGAPYVFYFTNLSGQAILITTIILNSKGLFVLARWFCISFIWFFFNGLAFLLGHESGIEYLNIILCMAPLVFFDKLSHILVISVLSLLGFLFSKLAFIWFEPVFINPNIEIIFAINMVILFFTAFLLIFFYRGELMRYAGIVEEQHAQLADKNKEITDSLNYAKRIQKTLLRFDKDIEKLLPESFIFFQPREVVGGDFFWFHRIENKIYGACADCTGHGIPGAFMSMIGITLLNDIVVDKGLRDPNLILDELNHSVIRMFRQREDEQRLMRDGMELSLLELDLNRRLIRYSCANSVFFVVRNGQVIEKKGNSQPIGWHIGEVEAFDCFEMQLEKNDLLFLFSDGFADQFGGKNAKKFLYSRFRETLSSMNDLSAADQRSRLESVFNDWKGDNDQIDDVTVVGVRIV